MRQQGWTGQSTGCAVDKSAPVDNQGLVTHDLDFLSDRNDRLENGGRGPTPSVASGCEGWLSTAGVCVHKWPR
ncbi:hypothetical protein JOF56_000627 [Kibdelosporangium banguiense]|uniref:Uncharacterized protein n=1 Tax=Kibdelosporangium banguiense TaxID=1365924 RepID=A0ABS4T756_9PSEU|nr:hypothetical protein [Kibdelosporangium banguiense]